MCVARGQELIRLVRAQDPTELAERVGVEGYVSASRRILWDSFAISDALPGVERNLLSSSPGELLRRLRVLELVVVKSERLSDWLWCRRRAGVGMRRRSRRSRS